MDYESPIEIIMGQMNMTLEDNICKAVQNAGIIVDKEELLRALRYDRDQYRKGYADRDKEITRCRDCGDCIERTRRDAIRGTCVRLPYCVHEGKWVDADFFCGYGKPKGSDNP